MVKRSREGGHALLVAVALMFMVALATQLFHDVLTRRLSMVRAEEQTVALIAIGDAGLAATMAGLADNGNFGGLGKRSFGGGTVASMVSPVGPGRVLVNVAVWFGGRGSTVRAEVDLAVGGPRVVRWERHGGAPEGREWKGRP
jgi:hypothetical protein